MKLLANNDLGLELTYLQRFLRNESVEIIVALKVQGLKAENIYSRFENYKNVVEDIKNEIGGINHDINNQAENFWEDNI